MMIWFIDSCYSLQRVTNGPKEEGTDASIDGNVWKKCKYTSLDVYSDLVLPLIAWATITFYLNLFKIHILINIMFCYAREYLNSKIQI